MNNKAYMECYTTSFFMGDGKANCKFGVANVIVLQKWLLDTISAELQGWKTGDFDNNSILNGFDFSTTNQHFTLYILSTVRIHPTTKCKLSNCPACFTQ